MVTRKSSNIFVRDIRKMRMDTIGKGTRRNEMTARRELEAEEIWDLQEMLFNIEEKCWSQKARELKLANQSLRRNQEFSIMKKKVWRQKEKYWRNREKSLRRKEKRLEDVLWKFGENCSAGISLASEGLSAQQLLPGIADDITLFGITTKLSWRTFHLLKSVSRGWSSAIRNYLVYDARVHSRSTETFVLVQSSKGSLALCCLRDNSRFELPPIPYHVTTRSSHSSVAVDGKVYVLGGLFDGPSDKVYMFDLAGQRSWTQCASMQTARSNFGCGVMGGKIYVFGGRHFKRYLCESEVYDPKENKWSLISPKCSLSSCGRVVRVGQEFFIYDGLLVDGDRMKRTNFLEIYHPVKDEWRKVEPFAQLLHGEIFAREGKVYSMDRLGIHIYSFDGNSWTQMCSHSFPAIQSVDLVDFSPRNVLVVEDELLAYGLIPTHLLNRNCVLRSTGFDTQMTDLTWREETGWAFDEMICSMYPIHL